MSSNVTLERTVRSANGYLAAAVGIGLILTMVVSFVGYRSLAFGR